MRLYKFLFHYMNTQLPILWLLHVRLYSDIWNTVWYLRRFPWDPSIHIPSHNLLPHHTTLTILTCNTTTWANPSLCSLFLCSVFLCRKVEAVLPLSGWWANFLLLWCLGARSATKISSSGPGLLGCLMLPPLSYVIYREDWVPSPVVQGEGDWRPGSCLTHSIHSWRTVRASDPCACVGRILVIVLILLSEETHCTINNSCS